MHTARQLALFTVSILALVMAAVPNPAAAAALGDDMPGFTPFAQHAGPKVGNESATDVVVQGDGRIVVALLNDAEADRRIMRLMPDGSLDPSFGTGGMWHVPHPNRMTVRSLALGPNGTIVFAGEDLNRPALVVGRLTSAGVLDPTFAGDGLHVSTMAAGSAPLISEVLVEPDGRVVFAGVMNEPPRGDQLLLGRLLATGADDPGFAGAPYQTFGSPLEDVDDVLGGLTRMPNGDFVLGSSRFAGGPMIWRLPSDGRFTVAANVDFPGDLDVPRDLTPTDATHVMALVTDGSTGSAMAWLDVSATPKIVPGGGADGVSRPFPASFQAQHMVRQDDGGYVVSGIDKLPDTHRAIARLRADTTLDPSFGTGGMRQLSGSTPYSFYRSTHAIAQAPNGAIVSAFQVNDTPTRKPVVDMLVGRVARVRAEVIAPVEPGIVETTTQFTVRVVNDGPDAAGAGSVAFTMGDGLRVMSYSGAGCTADARGGRCRFANLAAGATREVQVRVRANAVGTHGMSAAARATIFDDELGDDSATASLPFDAKPVDAAAEVPAPVKAAAQPRPSTSKGPAAAGLARLRLVVQRISGYQGRVLRGCGSVRHACRITRSVRGRVDRPVFVRIVASPVPASGRRTVRFVLQQRVGRRWVTRMQPLVGVTATGAADIRLPTTWRTRAGSWRVRAQSLAPRGARPVVSSFLYLRVR